jgi:restriction system protein
MPNDTYAGGFVRYINSKTEKIISSAEVRQIVAQIESGRLTNSFKTHREHVRHVKDIVKEKVNKTVCPKCGSPLVLRVAKQGANKGNEFYGCSSYPQCRHTAQIV